MPPLEGGDHVLEHLWAVGPVLGEGPVTHAELRAYQDNTGVEMTEWEVQTVRRLSIEYLNESRRATKRDCPPPWRESCDAKALAVTDTRDALRALASL